MIQHPATQDDQTLYEVLEAVMTLADQMESAAATIMEALDLTVPLANVLWRLDPSKPSPSMRDLAGILSCDPSSLTFVADRLEQRGLLERQVDPANRRVKRLVLTKEGMALRSRLIDATVSATPLSVLSPGEQIALRDLLKKVAKA